MSREFAERILHVRRAHATVWPSRQRIVGFIDELYALLFPYLSGDADFDSVAEVEGRLRALTRYLVALLGVQQARMPERPDKVAEDFMATLPEIYRRLWLDATAIHEGDPASESVDEVIAAYPGFFAIFTQRIANDLYLRDVPVLPRLFTEYAHVRTGIDIHPGATIGERFCIDHGTGVVIGETTVIGDNVKIYQGVSLGALSVDKELAHTKRHPTVERDVVVYSNATILGGETVIGHDSVIGGNVFLTESVPAYSVVYHTSEKRVRSKRVAGAPIDFQI